MTRNGIAFPHPPLVPLTDATESLLWPTPKAMDCRSAGPGTKDSTIIRRPQSGFGLNLAETVQAVTRNLFPTSKASDGERGGRGELLALVRGKKTRQLWGTPTAHPRTHTPRQVNNGIQLANQVGGALNPPWVEWLMGFPIGWTDLGDSETPSSPKSQSGSDVA